ncbi:MAG: pyruvate dehydrogenase complex dihydrolipoamide acetyltransferase [Pseudomonadota bacterium]
MPIDVFMPALSPTMEKGTLAQWLVKEGDPITSGDVIAEIETDKATMEVESIDEGRMGKILIAAGAEDVPVGTKIAVILEEGEDDAALETASSGSTVSDTPDRAAPKSTEATAQPTPDTPAPKSPKSPSEKPASDGRVKASPLAKRIAEQKGIDLASVSGSGPGGRIVKRDVVDVSPQAAAEPSQSTAAETPADAKPVSSIYPPPADIPFEEVKLSGMRKVIARRMTESKSTVPHFYLTIDVALDGLLKARKELNALLADDGIKLSVNDFIIKASALALKKVPNANVQFAGDKMYRFARQDISVAVAVPGGLVTPVIRDAGAKGLAAISSEMKELAQKARDGALMPEDYQGGTFSLSNLGMFGIREFGAVINPPQGAILAVGAGEKRAIVVDDAVAVQTMMSCTLAVDHRALDGAIGAEWLAAFKGFLETPARMML